MEEYKEKDIILCTVTNIQGTTVFVETRDGTKGSLLFSEISPGRIRNIRDFVVPRKVIVCKIMRVERDHLFLSLRRVTTDERKELMEEHKKEKGYKGVLKKILDEKAKEIIKQIEDKQTLFEYFEEAKKDSKKLEEHFNKEQISQLTKVLQEKKEKAKEIKKQFKLSCDSPEGINKIKEILKNQDNITYLGSSKFQIKKTATDLKKAGTEMTNILIEIEKQAKKNKCKFETKK